MGGKSSDDEKNTQATQQDTPLPIPPANDAAWEDGEDPVLVKIVRKTLAPYAGRVSLERLAEYRNLLILFLTTHPAMAKRYDQIRQYPTTVAATTVVPLGGMAGAAESKKVESGE